MGAHVPGMKRAAPPRLARILKERTARFRVRCQMSGPKCLPDSPASIHMPRDSCVTLRMCVLLCFPHAATARQDALHFWLPTTPGNMRCLICCLLTLSAVAAAQQPLEPLVKFRVLSCAFCRRFTCTCIAAWVCKVSRTGKLKMVESVHPQARACCPRAFPIARQIVRRSLRT